MTIFIDGGNLYRRLKECGVFPGKRFDYTKLIDVLLRGRSLSSKRYYIGTVRNYDQTKRSQDMVEAQQKFLSTLELQGFLIERGRIVYDHKIREKGVDVKIAIDLVIGAVENEYDTAVIVSSDTDLIPAIKYVISRGKKVEYAGFAERPSLGLARESSLSVLLLPDDIRKMAS